MSEMTFFWHDYETWGLNPRADRPSQFAGIRTNAELEIIDEEMMIYCRPSADFIPHPDSVLITGLLPQVASFSKCHAPVPVESVITACVLTMK